MFSFHFMFSFLFFWFSLSHLGATGFVGKTLLEKLLWSFPQLQCIYMLIREKHGKSAEQRFQEFVQHKIFERVRASYPDRLKKLKFLAGNIERENFCKLSFSVVIRCWVFSIALVSFG